MWCKSFSALSMLVLALPISALSTTIPPDNSAPFDNTLTTTPHNKPLHYGHVNKIADVLIQNGMISKGAGSWKTFENGNALWQYEYSSSKALSLEFGFSNLSLPASATLTVRSIATGESVGPFSTKDYATRSTFYTPMVSGSNAVIELRVSAADIQKVGLQLNDVTEGFIDLFKLPAKSNSMMKSESCEVDAVCPAGLSVSPQARAVAMYTFRNGADSFMCTGALVAKANFYAHTDPVDANFLTAYHCINNTDEADSMVLYWGYQNASCRVPGTRSSGTQLALLRTHYAAAQPGGTTLLASYVRSDFALVHLNTDIPAAANPFWLGWDRRDQIAHGAVIVHHPNGGEKRVSYSYNDLSLTGYGRPGNTHLRVPTYALGVTEEGSSGAPLLNEQGQVIGQLHGGESDCSNSMGDDYGRLASSWDGAGTSDTRLSDWLDPDGTGVERIAGMDATGQSEGNWFGIHGSVTDTAVECDQSIPDSPDESAVCAIPIDVAGGTSEVTVHILGSGLNPSNLVATLESPTGVLYADGAVSFGVLSPDTGYMVVFLDRVDRLNGTWTLRVHSRDAVKAGANGQINGVRMFNVLGASWWARSPLLP